MQLSHRAGGARTADSGVGWHRSTGTAGGDGGGGWPDCNKTSGTKHAEQNIRNKTLRTKHREQNTQPKIKGKNTQKKTSETKQAEQNIRNKTRRPDHTEQDRERESGWVVCFFFASTILLCHYYAHVPPLCFFVISFNYFFAVCAHQPVTIVGLCSYTQPHPPDL